MFDIRIDKENTKFKFRVAAIIECKNKILIECMNNNSHFCFSGGHVEALEDTLSAVNRELKEELFFEVEIKNLLFIHENFYEERNCNFHEICFYFTARPKDKDFEPHDVEKQEIDKGSLVRHQFVWVNEESIKNYKVCPKVIVEKYFNNKTTFEHFVTRGI